MLFLFLIAVFTSSALSCNIKEKEIVKKQQTSTFIFNLVGNQPDELYRIKHFTDSSTTVLYIGERGNLTLTSDSVYQNRLQTINNTETQIVFNLLNVSKDDAGDYCLVPLNSGIRLTVTDAPSVIITKQLQSILYPDSKNQLTGELNLTCDATSATKPDNHNLPLVYSWFKDGIFHTTTGNTSILYDNNIDISYKDVNISCIATDDPGCTEVFKGLTDGNTLFDVENNSRCIDVLGKSKNFSVQPEFGPYNVTIQPSGNITIRVTGEISVICESYCSPRCNISWLKHGDEVRDGDQLNMTNIQKSNAGRYTCLVKNKHGERNNSFYLQVSEKPENTEIWSENKRVGETFKRMSTNISFECKTDGSNVTYTWYIDGRKIKNSSESNILSPDYQLSGTLTCLVENSDGRDSVSVKILVDNDNNDADPSHSSIVTGVTLIIVMLVVVIVVTAMVIMYRKYQNKSTCCFKSKYPQRKSERKKKIDNSTVFPDTDNVKLMELDQYPSLVKRPKKYINRGLHMNVEDLVYADIVLPHPSNNKIHGKKEKSYTVYEKIDFAKKAPPAAVNIELDSDDDD